MMNDEIKFFEIMPLYFLGSVLLNSHSLPWERSALLYIFAVGKILSIRTLDVAA